MDSTPAEKVCTKCCVLKMLDQFPARCVRQYGQSNLILGTVMFPYSADIERVIGNEESAHELVRALFDRYCALAEDERERFVLALIGQVALISRRHQ